MILCPKCGEWAPDGAAQCGVCGQDLTWAETTKQCPACGASYGPEYTDVFCTCGVELQISNPAPAVTFDPAFEVEPIKPPAGTPCLVLYQGDKKPQAYFPLTKDALLIGRLDPVSGTFPDIDVNEWLDPASARKISRRHALILRSRTNQQYSLRPLAGNTGTQVEADMIQPMQDYPLAPGTRIILGGALRFKFEIA